VSFARITPIPEDQWEQFVMTSADPELGTTATGPVSEGQAAREWLDRWGKVESLASAQKWLAEGGEFRTDLWELLTFELLYRGALIEATAGHVVAFLRLKSIGLPGTPRHESVPHDQWVTHRSYQDHARRLIEGRAQLGDPVPEWTPGAVEPAPQPSGPTDAERIAALEERLATAARCWRGGDRRHGDSLGREWLSFTRAEVADMDGVLGA
jgi:hypothetical protein